ncbi:MAG: hypothetical protein A3C93_04330 [Candidatus Lloydbacteria bacterium RIFCSPHIGHO2_02_FULL_54_17]|uniref:Glycosyltransferase 2-like domain-containing protein n=1 Tax=Candidatus Lloydbacteria bacterium RIFCSPHIGHO2_02_FULL_54_17 TaxID=1798664 RepID=A0A1G2DF77_9BACT|nr:MAG: hypothetical protein A3C93_04330 [Candidatus Lloydbacteria bacterium RIFCSPHIGHO2_02_FULL_54_17]OGZ13921.1 MAG: hypothetical protein A2948_00220 [Candidatus Lloydbacteria bacterium RIFCSPLOWO2_01_FULL_54_18]OGZ16994.1 MAG: hypothetical protein A3H76_06325 [Candidatus Lloydbacteria bacterium RIFCSPLOWO2_02_FULL_54_12]
MKFTLVIPAFNEAPVVVPTLTVLRDALTRERDLEWAIIVADNASTDGTGDAVARIGDARIRVLLIPAKGKGNAVRSAFLKADGDVVGFTDADLPVLPEEIVAAAKIVAEGAADVVAGSRLLPESVMPDREWWRTVSSRVFNRFARLVVGVSVGDTQCPLKVMNTKGRDILLATLESTWFFDLEFFALAERLLLRVREVPVTWNEHRYPARKSKLAPADTLRAVVAMFRIRRRLSAQVSRLKQKMLT